MADLNESEAAEAIRRLNEAAAPAVKTWRADEIAAVIDGWFVEKIHNSVASRDTLIVNHLMAAKEELKRRLGKE